MPVSLGQGQGGSSQTTSPSPENNFLNTINPVTLTISIAALVTSLFSLWHNYLAPFNLKITNTNPTFAMQQFDEKEKVWWVPFFFIEISLFNSGKKMGKINDIRLLGEFTSKDKKTVETLPFYADRLVDPEIFEKNHSNRSMWLRIATKSLWYPILLSGKETKQIYLTLDHEPISWNTKKVGLLKLNLEILSSKSKTWHKIKEYKIMLEEDMFNPKSTRYVLADLDYQREHLDKNDVNMKKESGIDYVMYEHH